MEPTPTQRLASIALGTDVVAWVTERRDHSVRPSFRMIAADLRTATGGEIDVTDETIRLWYADARPESEASA